MNEILDEPFKESKKVKRTDFQKARRHTKIGWITFGICILFALLSEYLINLPRGLRNIIFILGFGFSLFHIICGTFYKLKGSFIK